MQFLYNIILHIVYFFLKIIALFNKKINLFITGRKETFSKLHSIKQHDKVIWLHAASLGEFEQGRPIIEKLKNKYPSYKIVVSFFSPSGYEIRKNYTLADVVCYLPFDTSKKVSKFIKQIHPDIAIIVKYEFWPNLLNELKKTATKTILVSGIFRENQSFFKSYGKWMCKSLNAFDHFFVQNQTSKNLLNNIGFENVSVSGDTRFDRVYEILQQDNTLHFIEEFKNNSHTLVAGSTWSEDEELLIEYINKTACQKEKFIIAPHNINSFEINKLKNKLQKETILLSEKENKDLKSYQVLIIDTIGILTKIYAYADVAYVGGGLKTGLHNILEPATFGVPVIFGGYQFKKFQEAKDLIALGGCKTITSQNEISAILSDYLSNKEQTIKDGKINEEYITKNTGATKIILNYINSLL